MKQHLAACLLLAVAALIGGILVSASSAHAADDPSALVVEDVELYSESHALVIGNDTYHAGWPRLSNAVKDARAVADELKRHGFRVTFKSNLDALALRQALEEFFVIQGASYDARLLLWFAGHGYTDDGEGFIVPVDAPRADSVSRFRLTALPMRRFGEYVRLARAKHVLAVFDACFAGTIFTGQRSPPPRSITALTRLPVRQFISSGDAEQKVFDDSAFRDLFIRALRGEDGADANTDGYVTASELGLYLTDRMINLTRGRQTPRYGKLLDRDYDRGEFVFRAAPLSLPSAVAAPTSALPSSLASTRTNDALAVELAFWDAIKNSTDPDDYRAYLEVYPEGRFAVLARVRAESARAAASPEATARLPPASIVTARPGAPPGPTAPAPPPGAQASQSASPPRGPVPGAPQSGASQVAVVAPQPPTSGGSPMPRPIEFVPPAPGTRFYLSNDTVLQVVSVKDWVIQLRETGGRTISFVACCAFPEGRGRGKLPETSCSTDDPTCAYSSRESGPASAESVRALWPLEIGKSTSWELNGLSMFENWQFTTRTLREQRVSVPAGQFDVLVFEVEERGRGRNVYRGKETFWFAPRLGFPVKYEARDAASNTLLVNWELTRIEP